MGVEPFLVTASVLMIGAQRLARRICTECKQPLKVPEQSLLDLGMKPEQARGVTCYKGVGCRNCADTGYRGRVALYEVMPFWEPLKDMVLNGASTAELKLESIKLGMQTLRMSGINKLKDGVTTIDEVVRVTAADVVR